MEQKFMPDVTEQERIQILQDTANKVREENYDSPLSEEEIENRKGDFFNNAIQIEDLEVEKKEATRELSEQIKEIKSLNRQLRQEIREGVSKRDGVLYDIAEYESGYMVTYDKTGDVISKRKLTPQEKAGQAKIFNMPATKTA